MNTRRTYHWIFTGFMLCTWIACQKSGSTPGTSYSGNLNSVESKIAGEWKLVSKIDSSVLSGNILSTATYSNFTYSPVVVFGSQVDNININPIAKTYTFKGANIGHAFEGPPDSTISGKGTWYYDLGNQSIYLNFGRFGFSMTDTRLTISVIGDSSPTLSNTWTFVKQ